MIARVNNTQIKSNMKKLENKEKIIWDASAQVRLPDPPDKKEVWIRLAQQIDIPDLKSSINRATFSSKANTFLKRFKPRINYGIGLALTLFFTIPIIYELFTTQSFETKISENQIINLSDGSTITLNSESLIKYDKNFNIKNRIITLEGEAYFDVKKSTIPFIVETDYGRVNVLGTSFNVRARDDGFEVGVNNGFVEVSDQSSTVQLKKGQFLKALSDYNSKDISDITYHNYPGWLNQKLYCEQTPLSKVCNEIERTFNIKIVFSDPSLKDLTVTGIIDAQDLKTVLSTISLLTQHQFKLDGGTYTII